MSSIMIFFVLAIVLLVLGVPIIATLSIPAMLYIVMEGIPIATIPQRMFAGIDNIVLICIPMFILAGNLMALGGIARRLITVVNLFFGNISGGLSHMTIIVCALFAAMTGSAIACMVAIGAIMLPYMAEANYGKDYSIAVVGAGAVLGPIIPPSAALIVYASLTNTSVVSLYKIGIPTGIIIAAALIIVSIPICRRRGYKGLDKQKSLGMAPNEKITSKVVLKTVGAAIPALLSPVIILGTLFTGICTPTESAVIAVLYAAVIGFFVYKELKIKEMPKMLIECAISSAKILVIIATANLFAWVISYSRTPQLILDVMTSFTSNRYLIMLFVLVVLLLMGCVLEAGPIMLITIPMFLPVLESFGYSSLEFGIILVYATCIGLLTPPFGTLLFTGTAISGVPIASMVKQVLPYIVAMIACLVLFAFMPGIITWIV